MKSKKIKKKTQLFTTILKYEYWPFWLFYIPGLVPYFLYALYCRSFIYFIKANPGIRFGGFFNYSKYSLLAQLPEKYIPKTRFLKNRELQNFQIKNFPVIVKPDYGERGKGVEVIQSQKEYDTYIQTQKENLLVQELIDYPLEFGVFYYSMSQNPNQFGITGITGKKFLIYKGNGKQSLYNFIENSERTQSNKEYLIHKFKDKLDLILPENQELILESIGNHSRGTEFYDASYLINKNTIKLFHSMAQQIEGFYVGRFDVKVKTEKDLETGTFLKVMEVNGVNSEATHIYDTKYSILEAYKEVFKHQRLVFTIAKNQTKKVDNGNFKTFLKELISYLSLALKI